MVDLVSSRGCLNAPAILPTSRLGGRFWLHVRDVIIIMRKMETSFT